MLLGTWASGTRKTQVVSSATLGWINTRTSKCQKVSKPSLAVNCLCQSDSDRMSVKPEHLGKVMECDSISLLENFKSLIILYSVDYYCSAFFFFLSYLYSQMSIHEDNLQLQGRREGGSPAHWQPHLLQQQSSVPINSRVVMEESKGFWRIRTHTKTGINLSHYSLFGASFETVNL